MQEKRTEKTYRINKDIIRHGRKFDAAFKEKTFSWFMPAQRSECEYARLQ